MTARRVRHYRDIARLARHALQNGAWVVRQNVIQWDVSGGCENPYGFTLEGRTPQTTAPDEWGKVRYVSEFAPATKPIRAKVYGADNVIWLDIDAPCRKCRACLERRAAAWAHKARDELSAASRSWFVTLTFSPERQFEMLARARKRLRERGTAWSDLTEAERFQARHSECGRELTTYLKRVRKGLRRCLRCRGCKAGTGCNRPEEPVSLRYLLVCEAHKSGLPHYHALIHERLGQPLTWWRIVREWETRNGFAMAKVVDLTTGHQSARYVTKYLAKAALARVRASQHYGSTRSA